jgi:translation initiation factor IF-1
MPEFSGHRKARPVGRCAAEERGWMSKEDLIELQGVVTEVLAGGNYKVKCGENHEVLARLNGKMRQFRIRVIQGDRVTVGVSPYDLKRGLITYRAK